MFKKVKGNTGASFRASRGFHGAFAELLTYELGEARKEAGISLSRLREEAIELQKKMEETGRELAGIEERRADIRNGEEFGAEFDALLRNSKIADIEINSRGITILTTELCVPFEGKKYWLAPFKIVISFGGDGHSNWDGISGVEIRKSSPSQKTSSRLLGGFGNWIHPHVRSGGSVCFGNIGHLISRAIKEQQWTEAVELIFPFLESCADDNRAYGEILKQVALRVEDDASDQRQAHEIKKKR